MSKMSSLSHKIIYNNNQFLIIVLTKVLYMG
jgi:hypothetical protein